MPNNLARRLAKACGAVPVITTATDANGVFAVDEWAKRQHCLVAEPARIKKVSSALLAGRTVRFASDWPDTRAHRQPVWNRLVMPYRASFALTITPTMTPNALHIIPRIAVLGIGCKRGTPADKLADAFAAFCARNETGPAKHCRRGQH